MPLEKTTLIGNDVRINFITKSDIIDVTFLDGEKTRFLYVDVLDELDFSFDDKKRSWYIPSSKWMKRIKMKPHTLDDIKMYNDIAYFTFINFETSCDKEQFDIVIEMTYKDKLMTLHSNELVDVIVPINGGDNGEIFFKFKDSDEIFNADCLGTNACADITRVIDEMYISRKPCLLDA